jgi:hypothetical protein
MYPEGDWKFFVLITRRPDDVEVETVLRCLIECLV